MNYSHARGYAATCIGPTALCKDSQRQVRKSMPMLAPACSHKHRHKLDYFSERLIAHQQRFPYCSQRLLAQGNRCRRLRLRATTRIGICFPTFYTRGVAPKRREIYADACGHMHRQRFPDFSAQRGTQKSRGNLCRCLWLHAATCIDIDSPTFLHETSHLKVGKSITMLVVACRRMHRYRFPCFSV